MYIYIYIYIYILYIYVYTQDKYTNCLEEHIGETGCLVKERIRQHIRQPQYQQIKVEEYLRLCCSGEFQMCPFHQIKQKNKVLRKAYGDYFIDRFKPLINQVL